MVLRPDGWVGTVVELDGYAGQKVERYFGSFLLGAAGSEKAEAKL